jgi:hypothetical protein
VCKGPVEQAHWGTVADACRYECRTAEQEEVPMESTGFLEWGLPGLRCQRGNVMIVVERQGDEEAKR